MRLLCRHEASDSGCVMGLLADMKFPTSSRMRPRWLAFVMMLPSHDVIFVHYKVPTIIMSRGCAQAEKVRLPCSSDPACLSAYLYLGFKPACHVRTISMHSVVGGCRVG